MSDADNSYDELHDDTPDDAGVWNVYFLSLRDPADPTRDFGFVKVGITKNDIERRIADLQTGNPYQIIWEDSFRVPAFVARQVEHWVHRSNATRVKQLEWVRIGRDEISSLVESGKRQAERLTDIAMARARWTQTVSNGKTRPPDAIERRLHADAHGVVHDRNLLALELRRISARISVAAGAVLHVPGILRLSLQPSLARFSADAALGLPGLPSECVMERVSGRFRWRNVPTRRSDAEVETLEREVRSLDAAMLAMPGEVRDHGERTADLADFHGTYLELVQRATRAKGDEDEIKAQMIQRLEETEAIAEVCSYRRYVKPVVDRNALRANHRSLFEQCKVIERAAVVRRDIYLSQSY